MIRDMRDEKRDTRNDLIILIALKMVKCESWTENMKAEALHMSQGDSADSVHVNSFSGNHGNCRLVLVNSRIIGRYNTQGCMIGNSGSQTPYGIYWDVMTRA